jgi:hypothetical protein
MLSPRTDAFPFQAVRDLLGILRAFYSAARTADAGAARLDSIRRVGLELHIAIDLALEHEPGTLGHAAAWERAERATRRLGELVDCTTPLEPMLDAAVARVRSGSDALDHRRERTRRARMGRG